MQIAHVIARLNDGGPARIIAALARDGMAQGDRIRIYHGRPHEHEDDLAPALAADGIDMVTLPRLTPRIAPRDDLASLLSLCRHLRADPPELLHCHTAKAGMIGRLAARILGIPCLHSYHGHVLHGYFTPRMSRILLHIERCCAARCHNHSLDPLLVEELRDHWRIGKPGRWHMIGNPQARLQTRSAAWHDQLDPQRPVILFLGRLTAIKDLPLFFATCDRINRVRPIQALVCGDGDQRMATAAIAARRPYPVHLTGFVPAEEALHRADLLLLTSRNEGQPLAVLEAMGVKVPVVCTAVGGLRRWIDHPAMRVCPRDSEALSQAALTILSDPTARDVQCAAACRVADSHLPETLLPAYRARYRAILDHGRAACAS